MLKREARKDNAVVPYLRRSCYARGFASSEEASALGTLIGELVREVGRDFDLSGLDGITVAYDYSKR